MNLTGKTGELRHTIIMNIRKRKIVMICTLKYHRKNYIANTFACDLVNHNYQFESSMIHVRGVMVHEFTVKSIVCNMKMLANTPIRDGQYQKISCYDR